jgi:protein-disulfide isomerase
MMRKEVLPIEAGRVRLVFRYFPLSMHTWARASAEAAACAYQQKNEYFWNFHDFFFEHQRELTTGNLRQQIVEHARGISGLDQSKFQSCLEHEGGKAAIEREMAFASANGIEAAPTVFLNGKETGIIAAEQLLTLIRELSQTPPSAGRPRAALLR